MVQKILERRKGSDALQTAQQVPGFESVWLVLQLQGRLELRSVAYQVYTFLEINRCTIKHPRWRNTERKPPLDDDPSKPGRLGFLRECGDETPTEKPAFKSIGGGCTTLPVSTAASAMRDVGSERAAEMLWEGNVFNHKAVSAQVTTPETSQTVAVIITNGSNSAVH